MLPQCLLLGKLWNDSFIFKKKDFTGWSHQLEDKWMSTTNSLPLSARPLTNVAWIYSCSYKLILFIISNSCWHYNSCDDKFGIIVFNRQEQNKQEMQLDEPSCYEKLHLCETQVTHNPRSSSLARVDWLNWSWGRLGSRPGDRETDAEVIIKLRTITHPSYSKNKPQRFRSFFGLNSLKDRDNQDNGKTFSAWSNRMFWNFKHLFIYVSLPKVKFRENSLKICQKGSRKAKFKIVLFGNSF